MAAVLKAAEPGREVGDTDMPPPDTLVNWMMEQHLARVDRQELPPQERVEMKTILPLPNGAREFQCARPGLGLKVQRFGQPVTNATKFSIGLFSTVDMPADDPNRFLCFFTGVPGFGSRMINAFDRMNVAKRAFNDYAIQIQHPVAAAGADAMFGQLYDTGSSPNASGERLYLLPEFCLDVKDVDQHKRPTGPKEAFVRYKSGELCSLAFVCNGANGKDDKRRNCEAVEMLVESRDAQGNTCYAYAIALCRLEGVRINATDELIFDYASTDNTRSGNQKTKPVSPIRSAGHWSVLDEKLVFLKQQGRIIVQQWSEFQQADSIDPFETMRLPKELCASPPLITMPAFGKNVLETRHFVKLNMMCESLEAHWTFALPPQTLVLSQYPNPVYWLTMAAVFQFSTPQVQSMYDAIKAQAIPIFNILQRPFDISTIQAEVMIRAAFSTIFQILAYRGLFMRGADAKTITVETFRKLVVVEETSDPQGEAVVEGDGESSEEEHDQGQKRARESNAVSEDDLDANDLLAMFTEGISMLPLDSLDHDVYTALRVH